MIGFKNLRSAVVLAAACVATSGASAQAQDTDDWEFFQDAARQMTRASVEYEGGKVVVVQCQAGALKVVLVGLPATTEPTRHLDATRADGRRDRQGWFATPGETAFTSTVSGRDARFLRGGGLLELRSTAGEAAPVRASFDLPTQNANLDRVLAACGYAATDERDALERAGPDLKTAYQAEHENDPPERSRTQPRSRSISGTARRASPAEPQTPPARQPADMSCIVRDAAYADCRFDHTQASSPLTQVRLRLLNAVKLDPASASANQGRVVYPGANGGEQPLIQVTREQIIG